MLDHHRAMLADRVRMDAYAAAIRAVIKPGDVVVDIGTGTGVLAFLACEAGARHVYAIEKTHIADMAMVLVRHRGLTDRITVLHEHSTKVSLPEPADVILTETLGAFGLEEDIVASIDDARARFARPGAAVIPSRIDLSLVPAEWPVFYAKHVGAWDGSPLRTFAANAFYVDRIPASALVAAPRIVLSTPDVSGSAAFEVSRDGLVHGFAGWFTATLAAGIELSNASDTHWDHAFLPLEQPLRVSAGDPIEVTLDYLGGQEWRWRGAIAGTRFDQTTLLDRPPCARSQ